MALSVVGKASRASRHLARRFGRDAHRALASWDSCLPTGAVFSVLRHETDGRGGGSLLFEVQDPERRPGKSMRAETVVIARHTRPWEQRQQHERLEDENDPASIPEKGAAACVSSQAGCALDCSFCDSGKVKPASNLPAWAIVAQVRAAQELLNPAVCRVVFMGMGEPLLNYSEVSRAITDLRKDSLFERPWAITVSTVGVEPRITSLAQDHPEVALALSLHAPNQALRSQLVPAGSRRWPLDGLMRAVRAHEELVGRVPMFAYTLLPGINDSEAMAHELSELLSDGRAPGSPRPFVNLVPYNPTAAGEEHGYQMPTNKQLRDFRTMLRARGLRATVRWSTAEGRPLTAACGQLRAAELQERPPLEQKPAVPDMAEQVADGKVSPQLLTRRLFQATSEQLLGLVEEHWADLNSIHVSAALVTLARSSSTQGLRSDRRFRALLRRTQELMRELQPQACANVLWSLGRLGYHPGNRFLSELFEVAEGLLGEFWPRNLANSMWACAKLRCRPEADAFLSLLAEQLAARAAELTPVELSNSLWGMGKLQMEPGESVLHALVETSRQQLPRWKAQDLASCLWALAALQYQPDSAFMDALASASHANLHRFKGDELVVSLRVFSQLKLSHAEPSGAGASFLSAAAARLAAEAQQLDPHRLDELINSFAELSFSPGEAELEQLWGAWASEPASLEPRALLTRLEAFVRLGGAVPGSPAAASEARRR
ncbi:unnamed protein product [Polarella glacialis]|uniref:Radical SAM core domain-containing protein n=1 Tax=Polarella glacialis TaxID=89957 RepID=A0A813EFF6_POLGL|nr:unnamed protein product [Polarella glacialis]